jgi:hypothetical protein
VSSAVLCVRSAFSESRSSELERKVGGKFHLKLNIGLRPIANKYHEGKMKRTLKRELKGKRMEPVILARLLCIIVKVGCCNVSASTCSEHAMLGASCLGSQHLFLLEEISEDMEACLRAGECAW